MVFRMASCKGCQARREQIAAASRKTWAIIKATAKTKLEKTK